MPGSGKSDVKEKTISSKENTSISLTLPSYNSTENVTNK
jgi:hypothetical protein